MRRDDIILFTVLVMALLFVLLVVQMDPRGAINTRAGMAEASTLIGTLKEGARQIGLMLTNLFR